MVFKCGSHAPAVSGLQVCAYWPRPRIMGGVGSVESVTWATSPARTLARPAGSARSYASAAADRTPLDRLRTSPSAVRKGTMA